MCVLAGGAVLLDGRLANLGWLGLEMRAWMMGLDYVCCGLGLTHAVALTCVLLGCRVETMTMQ